MARSVPNVATRAARWALLGGAIGSEVAGTLALRAAIDEPLWYALVVVGYLASFVLLALALRRGLGIGVAYGIWSAIGVALTAVLAAALFGDPLTVLMGFGIVLIMGGVLCVELGAQAAARNAPDHEAASSP